MNLDPGTLEGDLLSLGAKQVRLTHRDKVYFPSAALTKGDVLAHYRAVAPYLLPHLHERPVVMERWPDGVEESSFYQKDAPSYFPAWLRTHAVRYRHGGKTDHHPLVDDVADLLYLVNLGTLTLHTFLSLTGDLEHPDILVIDVDPPEAASGPAGLKQAVDTAFLLREELTSLGLGPLVKTSGKRGLHLALPLDGSLDYQQARDALAQLFDRLVARYPDLMTRDIRKAKRGDRVPARGHTAAVSMPVTWGSCPV